MSHVTLTDVEWINLNVLVVIRAGLQYDPLRPAAGTGSIRRKPTIFGTASTIVVLGHPRRRHDPVPAARRPGDVAEHAARWRVPMALVHPPKPMEGRR